MLYINANAVLKKVKEIDPQYELNGHRNIWILKPSDLCCGTGIVMTHKLNHIMKRVQDCPKDYFVVQKYIGLCYFTFISFRGDDTRRYMA